MWWTLSYTSIPTPLRRARKLSPDDRWHRAQMTLLVEERETLVQNPI